MSTMQALNQTIADSLYAKLSYLYKLRHVNSAIDRKRGRQFQSFCEMLNDYYIIPDGYCPFYYDKVSCWNATPANTRVRIKCVTWQFDHPNPAGYVELQCEDGQWQNISGDDLVTMYKPCLMTDVVVEYGRLAAQSGYGISIMSLILAFTIFLYLKKKLELVLMNGCRVVVSCTNANECVVCVKTSVSSLIHHSRIREPRFLSFANILLFLNDLFRKVRCGRNRVHLNLFASHLLRCIFSTIQYFYSYHNEVEVEMNLTRCRTITTIWNYFLLSSYFWIFVEGLYLHNAIYVSVFREPDVWPFALFGWGAPFLLTCFWTVTKIMNDQSRCWLSLDYHLILRIPLFIIIIAEVIMAINIARQLYYKLQDEPQNHERMRYKKLARATLLLIGGTGVNFFIFDFVLAVTGIVSRSAEIAHTVYVIVNSLWGTVVSFLYCFTSEEIQSDWKLKEAHRKLHRAIKREFKNSRLYYSKKESSQKPKELYHCSSKIKGCDKCETRKSLLEKTGLLKSIGSSAATLCSTGGNSNQNTICAKTPYPPPVLHLSYCKEESEDVSSA